MSLMDQLASTRAGSAEKRGLFFDGEVRIGNWCLLNGVERPGVVETPDPKRFNTCAYYRDGVIYIAVDATASIGRAGRAWSYPGYVVDRTAYGVLAHELAHHVDHAHGAAGGVVSHAWRKETGEQPITTYATNDNEWFAEIFRLFVTNPDLLALLRPRMFARLSERWPKPSVTASWEQVLADSRRHLNAARNKVNDATRRRRLAS